MELKLSLQKLGLSALEADLYLALSKKGESPVGPLIKQTGIHRELVYGALKRLEKQGLVQSIEKKKIRHYQAADPKIFVLKSQEISDLTQQIVPDLNKLYREPDVSVKIFEGPDGYEEVQKDIQLSLKDKDIYFVIGGSGGDWYDVTRSFYMKYRRQSLRRGITMRMITYTNQLAGVYKNEPKGFCTARALPTTFPAPSSTKLYADKIIIQIFGEQPLSIMIKSQAVSKAYRQYFNTLWELAKSSPKK